MNTNEAKRKKNTYIDNIQYKCKIALWNREQRQARL